MNAIAKQMLTAETALTNVRADLLLAKLNCRSEVVPQINRALELLNAAACKLEEAAAHETALERIEGDELLAEEMASDRREHAAAMAQEAH